MFHPCPPPKVTVKVNPFRPHQKLFIVGADFKCGKFHKSGCTHGNTLFLEVFLIDTLKRALLDDLKEWVGLYGSGKSLKYCGFKLYRALKVSTFISVWKQIGNQCRTRRAAQLSEAVKPIWTTAFSTNCNFQTIFKGSPIYSVLL